ncbi:MAG: RagB/SusD family nutrient uptake outer membrane protein [Bacteroidales bacterium]|nr:RagB/SusD family nutrient uptake outer membrane protein [Bacteroidales bacterium]
MKRYLPYIFLCLSLSSCQGFLDQVPSDRLTLEQIFSKRSYSEDFLATVYSYRLDESRTSYNTSDGCSDDIDISYDRPENATYDMTKINIGNWSASSDYFNNWTPLYRGIRAATVFMQHIRSNAEMLENGETRRIEQYYNEARFLRAYFAFLILRQYGPIVLPEETAIPADAESSDPLMQKPRSPYNACVDWIVDELDEAGKGLPLHFTDQLSSDYGRATRAACMAVKARLLLYAASPQFNGNPAYRDVQNPDGTSLFAASYDAAKWKRAADAAKDLIDLGIFDLYRVYYEGTTTLDPFSSVKDVFLEPWNCEVIWCLTTHDNTNVHRHGSPRYYNGYESVGITQSLVDEFQMWDGRDRTASSASWPYSESGFSTADFRDSRTGWVYAPAGTYNMWVNREPRFYLNVAFNGAYAIYNDQGDRYKWQLNYSGNDGKGGSWDFPRSGYVRVKGVSPAYNAKTSTSVRIPWILFRYAEVCLNYAEALNEYDPGNGDILKYLNLVRVRAGMPEIAAGKDQDEMRSLIRHERRVELCGEHLRYYDTRRWLIAEQTDGGPFYGMNVDADGDAFYQRTVFETRVFRKEFYLFPIPQSEINKDKNIIQNPGW